MHSFPSKSEIERLRREYPIGMRIELTAPLDDPYSKLTTGDRASIIGVDDAGNILCRWDCGSSLNLILGDSFKVIPSITDIVYEQIMVIRLSGKVNMLDITSVQRLAFEQDSYELVDFIENNRRLYSEFILKGKRE